MDRVAADCIGEVGTVIIFMGHHSKYGPVGLGTPATATTRPRGVTGVRAHRELQLLSRPEPFNTATQASQPQPVRSGKGSGKKKSPPLEATAMVLTALVCVVKLDTRSIQLFSTS